MKIRKVIMAVSVILIIAGIAGIVFFLLQSKKTVDDFQELKKEIISVKEETDHDDNKPEEEKELEYYEVGEEKVQKKFYDLYMRNRDFIGWITIDDTPVDYPVMHNFDNEEKYLHTDFDGNYNYAGCIFASTMSDITYPSDNILLYGHHMNTNIMFAPIMKYEDQEYAKKHKIIHFDTLVEDADYEVIAAFRTKIYPKDYKGFVYYKFNDAFNEEEFNDYVNNAMSLSSIKMDTGAEYGDKLLSLSTCAYHTQDGRFVVVAKKIRSKKITKLIGQ